MIRRAAVLLSSKVPTPAPPASSTAPAAVRGASVAKTVTLEDSKTAVPNTVSNTESLTPWEGWFSSFLRSRLGEKYYGPIRDFWLFRPDDQHNLEQMYRPTTKVRITDAGDEASFRHPSPGSQDPVRLPDADVGHYREDPYNVAHYPTDTSRRGRDPANPNPDTEAARVALLDADDPRVEEARQRLEAGPGSSPGNKGTFATGKSDYDSTGLRATMSANHEAMNAELDKLEPDHLPTYSWLKNEDEIIAWHEERDLPLPMGAYEHTHIPTEGRVARW